MLSTRSGPLGSGTHGTQPLGCSYEGAQPAKDPSHPGLVDHQDGWAVEEVVREKHRLFIYCESKGVNSSIQSGRNQHACNVWRHRKTSSYFDTLHFRKHEDIGTKRWTQITSPQGSSMIAFECDEDVYIFIRLFSIRQKNDLETTVIGKDRSDDTVLPLQWSVDG